MDRSVDRSIVKSLSRLDGTEESARSAGDIFASGRWDIKKKGGGGGGKGEEKRALDLPCMRIRWNIASSAGFEWPTGYSSAWLLVLVNIAGPLMRNSRECLRFSASYVQFCTAVAFPERRMAGSDVVPSLDKIFPTVFFCQDSIWGTGRGKKILEKVERRRVEGFQNARFLFSSIFGKKKNHR